MRTHRASHFPIGSWHRLAVSDCGDNPIAQQFHGRKVKVIGYHGANEIVVQDLNGHTFHAWADELRAARKPHELNTSAFGPFEVALLIVFAALAIALGVYL